MLNLLIRLLLRQLSRQFVLLMVIALVPFTTSRSFTAGLLIPASMDRMLQRKAPTVLLSTSAQKSVYWYQIFLKHAIPQVLRKLIIKITVLGF